MVNLISKWIVAGSAIAWSSLVGTNEAQAASIIFGEVASTTIGLSFGTAVADGAIGFAQAEALSTDGESATSTFTDSVISEDSLAALAQAEASAEARSLSPEAAISGTSLVNLSFTNESADLLAITLVGVSVVLELGAFVDTEGQSAQVGGEGFVSVECPGCLFFDESGPILDDAGDPIDAWTESATASLWADDEDGFSLFFVPDYAVLGPGHTLSASAGASFHGVALSTPEPSVAFLFLIGLSTFARFARAKRQSS